MLLRKEVIQMTQKHMDLENNVRRVELNIQLRRKTPIPFLSLRIPWKTHFMDQGSSLKT